MKNKYFNFFARFSNAKFLVILLALAVFIGLNEHYAKRFVSAQIEDFTKESENGAIKPDFIENSGKIDTSFKANLLNTSQTSSSSVPTRILKQPDGKYLFIGNFSNIGGIPKRNIVRLNPDLSVDLSFETEFSLSFVRDVALQPDGKILIAGSYSINGGSSGSGIFRVNTDGGIDETFQSGLFSSSNTVQEILVQPDGRIIAAGGNFRFGNVTFPGIVRLETDGSLDPSFNPGNIISNNTSPTITETALQPNGKILIAGSFTNIDGFERNRLARLNADGSLDKTFDVGIGPNGLVNVILPTGDGKILIAGNFTSVNGIVQSRIARLNPDGSLDSTFKTPANLDPSVNALVLQPDGKIIAGGDFRFSSNPDSRAVFRLNSDGSLDTAFNSPTGRDNSGINSEVTDLYLEGDGKVLIAGAFTLVGGQPRSGVARLNSDGTLDSSFNILAGQNGTVNKIVIQTDGKILIAGNFTYIDGVLRKGFARLNRDGSLDTTFNSVVIPSRFNPSNFLDSLAIQPDGKILVSGSFQDENEQVNFGFSRLNQDGSRDTSFSISVGSVLTTAIQADGKIVIGGNFTKVNDIERRNLARIKTDGSLDTSFNPGAGANGTIQKLAVQPDGKIIITGNFSSYNGTVRRNIARINPDGSLDTSFNTDLDSNNSSIKAIVVQPDGKILLGGSFFQINGVIHPRFARLNADGSLDTAFGAAFPQGIVNDIVLQPDGKIIVVGGFINSFGAIRRRIVRFNSDGSIDPIFNPGDGANDEIFAAARQSNGKILIGGQFTEVSGVPRAGIARIRVNTCVVSPLFDFNGDGKTNLSIYRPQEGVWFISNQLNETFSRQPFGLPTDLIAPADYDGDEITDIAVFRPSNGTWYILNSRIGFRAIQFGLSGDIPLPADFDGDGKDDLALFRPSNGTWYIQRTTLGFTAVQFGAAGDIPIIADMDGDCKADLTVFRPSNGAWYWLKSSDGNFRVVQFGMQNDIPVAGDYDLDGKTDLAVFRPSNATWYLLKSQEGFSALQFGNGTDTPVPADYDGDGKTDVAVFRDGIWYVIQSADGKIKSQLFGQKGDQPIPSAYLSK